MRSCINRRLPSLFDDWATTPRLGFSQNAASIRSTAVFLISLPLRKMKITGTHIHKALGTFTYKAEYTVSRPATTWFVDWSATAVGSGRVLQLSGGSIEILVGSSGAASLLVEEKIRVEIDALT